MEAFKYETFLRAAFGFAKDGRMLDRCGDPAGIANTDQFFAGNIDVVKAGTAYAMEIMSKAVVNHVGDGLPNGEDTRLMSFTKSVITAPDIQTIAKLITDYQETVIDCYFNAANGYISLK